jgi:hypothetical protein
MPPSSNAVAVGAEVSLSEERSASTPATTNRVGDPPTTTQVHRCDSIAPLEASSFGRPSASHASVTCGSTTAGRPGGLEVRGGGRNVTRGLDSRRLRRREAPAWGTPRACAGRIIELGRRLRRRAGEGAYVYRCAPPAGDPHPSHLPWRTDTRARTPAGGYRAAFAQELRLARPAAAPSRAGRALRHHCRPVEPLRRASAAPVTHYGLGG